MAYQTITNTQIAILLQEIISTVKSNDNDSYWPEETQQPPKSQALVDLGVN
ncbi:24078_t:CDS:2, partial [Racocetra persica]